MATAQPRATRSDALDRGDFDGRGRDLPVGDDLGRCPTALVGIVGVGVAAALGLDALRPALVRHAAWSAATHVGMCGLGVIKVDLTLLEAYRLGLLLELLVLLRLSPLQGVRVLEPADEDGLMVVV